MRSLIFNYPQLPHSSHISRVPAEALLFSPTRSTRAGRASSSNQIKSLLLSHHHSTFALVSEILESVLQTVQKQFTYRQYILIQMTMCNIHIHIQSTHSVLFKTYLQLPIHIIHSMNTFSIMYTYTHTIFEGAADFT